MLVAAVEDAIKDLSQRADVVQVVQNDHQGAHCPRDAAALLSQTGQILTQLLQGIISERVQPKTQIIVMHPAPAKPLESFHS